MLLVNFLGGFDMCPRVLRHTNDYCSYADAIMPHFLFAVGFSLRLTFGRRVQTGGAAAAYGRVVRRLLGLVLVSFVVYTVEAAAGTWRGGWYVVGGLLPFYWITWLILRSFEKRRIYLRV